MTKVQTIKINMKKANATNLKWPTDKWGLCSPVKKALISCIGRSAGHPDKMKLLRAVLKEAMAHLEARDKQANEAQAAIKAEAIVAAKAIADAAADAATDTE